MSPTRALLVPETNVLLDILLLRDGVEASLLLSLAEEGRVDMVVPEYALIQFEGKAHQHIREHSKTLDQHAQELNELRRSEPLSQGARTGQHGNRQMKEQLSEVQREVPRLVERISKVARIEKHSLDAQLRGQMRYMAARPPTCPDSRDDSDCCIYEAILDIARADLANARPKFFVTRDSDFDDARLKEELAGLGFRIRGDIGRLFGELRRPS